MESSRPTENVSVKRRLQLLNAEQKNRASRHLSKRKKMSLEQVKQLPEAFASDCVDKLALLERDECAMCSKNEGHICLKPCGHAAFCYECVTIIRNRSIVNGRLCRCPVKSCLSLVRGWMEMFNIHERSC